jgi:PAS domain S-box-containing protein
MTRPRVVMLGRGLCLVGAALGALGLLGWIVGAPLLTTLGRQPPMMPNAGIALLLAGSATALVHGRVAARAGRIIMLGAAIVVLAIGAGTVAEYAFSVDLHIDQLIVRSQAGPYPGRPSPLTGIALMALGGAILLIDFRPVARVRPSEGLVLCSALIGFTALLGFLFGAGPIYRLARVPVIGAALPTGLGLLSTSVGLLLAWPGAGVMQVIASPGPGGLQARRLMPATVLGPALLGGLIARLLSGLGGSDAPILLATMAALTTAGGLTLLMASAVKLDRAHDALESIRRRTVALVEQASDGIFVADLTGRYTDVNTAGCSLLGYCREELVGKTIIDLLPPEDVERLLQSKAEMLEGGVHVAEWRLRRKDGSLLPVEVSAKILPDGRWQGIVRDASERKLAEERLRQSQERFELALKGADLAAWDWNVKTGEVFFNQRWGEMRGYRPEEVRPHLDSWLTGVHPDDLPHVRRALDDHFRGLVPEYETEHRVSTKSGEWLWILDRGKVFARDDEGNPSRMVGTELDITAKKQVEAEQRFLAEVGAVFGTTLEYEETLTSIARLAVRHLADLCIVDVVGEGGEVGRLKVLSRNPGEVWACELLMQIPADRSPRHLGSAALEARRAILTEEVTPEVASAWAESEAHVRALRGIRPRSAIEVPLLARGNPLGVISLLSSTSSQPYGPAEVLLAEELARRAALAVDNARLYLAATRAVQARDDVLGIVAHDLRNPLASIVMGSALLRNLAPGAEREAARLTERLERAASRMNRLVEDLLDVTRMETTGRLPVERTRSPAGPIVSDAVEAQKALAYAASLELRIEMGPDLPEVWADRERLLQVFENLIGNAVKFTEAEGRITVGAAARDDEVLFWVADTGRGAAPEDLPHLFDRFWQARKTERRGAGLGLPIVKGIVEAHRGRVWVESVQNRGSTFFFTIPTAPRVEVRMPGGAPG